MVKQSARNAWRILFLHFSLFCRVTAFLHSTSFNVRGDIYGAMVRKQATVISNKLGSYKCSQTGG